jgi:hypothetical protein
LTKTTKYIHKDYDFKQKKIGHSKFGEWTDGGINTRST